jgi:dienelactone hydrolase
MTRMILVLFIALGMISIMAPAADAKVVGKPVAYKDGDVELEGYLAYDDSKDGPRPGVLVVHEWWGLNDYAKKRADMLAELGYVAFAADMYGKGVLAKDAKTAGKLAGGVRGDKAAWMKRAKAGLDQLTAVKQCDPKRLAGIGYCFGGSTVLNMALDGMDLDAVVSFHGALPNDFTVAQAKSAKATLLICHGAKDAFIKDEVIAKFRSMLDEAGTDYIFEYYAGAVHSFTNPEADAAKVPGLAYQRAADVRSWAHMRQLFDEVFARK